MVTRVRHDTSRLPGLAFNRVSEYAEYLSKAPAGGKRRNLAKLRRSLVQSLSVGNWLFRSIRLIESHWRREVLTGFTPYDPDEEQQIRVMYQEWLRPSGQCVDDLNLLRKEGFKVLGAADFQKYIDLAEEIVTGNISPFPDDETCAQWSIAVSKARNPRPMKVDDEGRMFEESGVRIWVPGLTPERVKEGIADLEEGRTVPLQEIIQKLGL